MKELGLSSLPRGPSSQASVTLTPPPGQKVEQRNSWQEPGALPPSVPTALIESPSASPSAQESDAAQDLNASPQEQPAGSPCISQP